MANNKILTLFMVALFAMAAGTGRAQAQGYFTPDGAAGTGGGLQVPAANPFTGGGGGSETAPKIGTHYIPTWSTDEDVAIIYYRLLGKAPDFESWARNSDDLKKADPSAFTQRDLINNLVARYRADFSNMVAGQNIVVRARIKLSDYSDLNQGFLVEDGFSDDAFFRYKFGGNSFAVVPQHISDFKWLAIPPNLAKDISANLAAGGHMINVALFLQPTYSSPDDKPALLQDGSYYLISGTVSNLMMFDNGWTKVLWEKNTDKYNSDQQQELLNLKQ